jgi:uncharacterized protein (TIGR02145 family)
MSLIKSKYRTPLQLAAAVLFALSSSWCLAPSRHSSPPSAPASSAAAVVSSYLVSDTLVDGRDGKRYRTVVIGGRRWFAENLDYKPDSGKSWCYGGQDSNCVKYGRLYDWETARAVCPSGYHLPSREEWNDLVATVGIARASVVLKAKHGWARNRDGGDGNGTDEFGFSALPGYFYSGYEDTDDGLETLKDDEDGVGVDTSDEDPESGNTEGYWWTSTERNNKRDAYSRYMDNTEPFSRDDYDGKAAGLSVRCVGDK